MHDNASALEKYMTTFHFTLPVEVGNISEQVRPADKSLVAIL